LAKAELIASLPAWRKLASQSIFLGVSVFERAGDAVLRVADAGFRPGDDFCAVWHLLDLLPEGVAGWRAQISYG
jgi:hypothetical protein